MDLLLRIFGASAVVVGVPLCFYLLTKLFPFKPHALSKQKVSFEALRSKYAKWEVAAVVPLFSFFALAAYLIFRGLSWVSRHSLEQNQENRYLMLLDPYFLMIFVAFTAIVISAFPTDFLYRLLLKENYAEYNLYVDMKVGFDSWRAFRFISILTLVPSMIFIGLAIDYYVRFTENQIITNRYWGFGEITHDYSQITRIKSVRFIENYRGMMIEDPYYVLHFNDGSFWSTRNTLYRADYDLKLSDFQDDQLLERSAEKEREIFAFVAMKCGKKIERYDFLDKEDD